MQYGCGILRRLYQYVYVTYYCPHTNYLVCFSARLLSSFGEPNDAQGFSFVNSGTFLAHWRFLYFHGQKNARLGRQQTVYSKPPRGRSPLITLLSPVLFLAPNGYLREMEAMWTDEIIVKMVWQGFMSKLLREWEDIILWVRSLTHIVNGFPSLSRLNLKRIPSRP